MGTVLIPASTGSSYSVYGTATAFATYAAGSLVFASAYSGAAVDDRSRALVEATRILQAQSWLDDDNADVDAADALVVQAAYELALAGLADVAVLSQATASSNVRRLEAKGVSIERFGPELVGRFPARVLELIGDLLTNGGGLAAELGIGASAACGTGAPSDFDACDPFDFSRP